MAVVAAVVAIVDEAAVGVSVVAGAVVAVAVASALEDEAVARS